MSKAATIILVGIYSPDPACCDDDTERLEMERVEMERLEYRSAPSGKLREQ